MPREILQNIAHVNVLRNISLLQGSFHNAVKRTNIPSRAVFHQIVKENNALTPQDIGRKARRISIQENQNKTPQDRFIDIFA
ncbi:hypothetical protein AMJ80_07585 [bacterium SM23_31]|nr:MAG: hypothetical protein AMJ80_07585 [bacterium SM23_31]